jgi:hypothetical protein
MMVATGIAVASAAVFAQDLSMAHALVREQLPVPGEARGITVPLALAGDMKLEISDRAFRALANSVDAEAVEDGIIHPAEQQLAAFVGQHGGHYLREMLFRSGANAGRTAAFLRLLGRIRGLDNESRRWLVQQGLTSRDVEVRDAAVQAAELWGDRVLAAILNAHHEPIRWLASYVSRVASDLEGYR